MHTTKFNIGEKVSVIDATITGNITAIKKDRITIKDENGFLYNYASNEIVKLFNLKESSVNYHKIYSKESTKIVKTEKKRLKQEVLEVDLHIHQITKSNKHLSNYDMLQRQTDFANQKIKFAIKNNIKKIVFIHGIGQGVLKAALYQLFKKYKVEINDANYQKYGKGATEIYIYKNL